MHSPFGRDPQLLYFVDQSHRSKANFADFISVLGKVVYFIFKELYYIFQKQDKISL
jgi:hypothetical protein